MAAVGIVVGLTLAVHAQDTSAMYMFVLDKANLPVLEINPKDITIVEDAGPATIAGVSRYGWPLKLTVLVDNGPGTTESLVHLRNGLIKLFEGIPRQIPVSLIAIAPNPRWLVRDSKDLVQLKDAVGLLTSDEGYGRFSDALSEYAARLDREFLKVEDGLPPYLPVLVSIATTNIDGSDVRKERNEKMLLSLRKHRVWTHMVMVTPGRRTNEPGDVSNLDVDDGQNDAVAQLVKQVTEGSYVPVSGNATTGLATTILPNVAQTIALRYLKQMTQHRIVFERAAGATGPMKNFKLTLANHPGARVVLSTDGSMP
jgi:hypothetical protein